MRADLTAGLVCYARSVAGVQWDRMQDDPRRDDQPLELFRTIEPGEPETPSQEAAFGKWLDQTSDREAARNDRIHGAAGVIPTPLWIVLFFTSGVIFMYLLSFADSGERAVVQAVLMGTVTSVIVSMLLLLQFLDSPFHEGVGGLEPVATERTLVILGEGLQAVGIDLTLPCDEEGVAL